MRFYYFKNDYSLFSKCRGGIKVCFDRLESYLSFVIYCQTIAFVFDILTYLKSKIKLFIGIYMSYESKIMQTCT